MLDRRDLLKLGGATIGVGLVAGDGGAQDETPTETETETEGTPQAPPEGEFYAAARLTGAAQEPEPVDTSATGATTFTQTDEGLAYELFVADIENVTMAHIHVGSPDEAGPVAQWLDPSADATEPDPIDGEFAGLLNADTITGDNLTGPLEGEDLDALLSEMDDGNTYVNVHTEQNPEGEIRGQIRVVAEAPSPPDETPTPDETPEETADETPEDETETPTPEDETPTPTPEDETPTPTPEDETPTPTPEE